jgi:hypothetical protein
MSRFQENRKEKKLIVISVFMEVTHKQTESNHKHSQTTQTTLNS